MPDWEQIIQKLRTSVKTKALPSVSQIAEKNSSPYRILVSTIISLRTKDEVTKTAALRLLKKAPSLKKLSGLSEKEIAGLIYPAGFYKTKAYNLKKTANLLINKYDSKVPQDLNSLLSLPGVGRKTANLVLNLGYGINAICVDTHVHRISNRTGWIKTKNPEETEMALMKILPEKYWIEINEILVKFGQNICTPVSPKCSLCPITEHCVKTGVNKTR